MVEAQKLFDTHAGPLCPQQLTAPVLHKVGDGVTLQLIAFSTFTILPRTCCLDADRKVLC